MSNYYDEEEEFEFEESEEEIEEESFDADLEDEDGDDLFEDDDDEYSGEEDAECGDLESMIEEGEELLEAEEYSKAIEHFTEAVDHYAEEPNAHFYLGLAYYSQLRELMENQTEWDSEPELVELYEAAVGSFDESVSLDEEHTGALNCLGALYCLRDNYEGAVKCWEKSLEVDPDQDDVERDLSEARAQLEDE